MIVGTHFFKGYEIEITAETKPEDLKWIFLKHPEFKKTVDYNSKNSKPKNPSKSNGSK